MRSTLIFLLILVFILPGSAAAHGILISSTPAPNSVLEEPPSQIILTFSEPLAPRGNRVQIRDARGGLLEVGDPTLNPQDATRLILSVPELAEGIYSVEYRVLSAVDGHFTLGRFDFGLGNPAELRPLLEGRVAAAPELLSIGVEAVLRWTGLLAQAALVGGMAFGYFLWRGAWKSGRARSATHDMFISRFKQSSLLAWGLLLISHLGSYSYRALQQVSGAGSSGEGVADFFVPLLTSYGHIWALNLVLILFYRMVVRGIRPENWSAINNGLFLGGLILFTQGLAGHAAALPGRTAAAGIVVQFVHTLAVSLWVGGLFQLAWNVPRSLREVAKAQRDELYAYLVPRFSTLALGSVALLVGSGLILAWLQVGDLAALFTTFYGNVLSIKTLVFLPLLGLGAINFLFLVPRIIAARSGRVDSRTDSTPGLLLRTVRGEVLLATAVLSAAAVLSALPPARVATLQAGREVLPASDPQALAILQEVDGAMNRLATLREHQVLSDDAGNAVHTFFEYQSPDRFRYRVLGGGRGVTVGKVQYYRALGKTSWRVTDFPKAYVFPNYNYAGRAIGAHIDEETEFGGQEVIIVGFWLDRDLEFEFELWIDKETHLVRQLTMEGPGHHMLSTFTFNPPLEIKPPL
ncbi:MAG: copper resistance protein CopC/CopD [Chloroflexi bacterium]|nr:copper resistance protein CopC/CopD [Chloroflexota bacterium]